MGNQPGILDKRLALGLNDFTAVFGGTRVRVKISPSHKAPGATTTVLVRNPRHPEDAAALAGAFLAYEHYAPRAEDHRMQTIANFLAIHLTADGNRKQIERHAAFFRGLGLSTQKLRELERRRRQYFETREKLEARTDRSRHVFEL